MKRAIAILAVLACVAFAGEMVTGGAELTKFKGYGTFRWDMYGEEDTEPGSAMSTYTYVGWYPMLNQHVDGVITAKISTPSDYVEIFDVECAYLNLHLTENISLAGGQFKKPFGYGFTRSGGSMYFADRAGAVGGLSDFSNFGGYGVSTMLTASFSPVTVDLAISNNEMFPVGETEILLNKQFTARVVAEPTEWFSLGGSLAMISAPDDETTEEQDESWGANGIDVFAVADYPVSPTGTLVFVGEYLMYGAADTYDDAADGSGMSVMAGYDMALDGYAIKGIMPAVRYDMVTPIDLSGEAEDTGRSYIDFCVNIDLFSEMNTLQIGARNNGFENSDPDEGGTESYTDMYAKWRMNF